MLNKIFYFSIISFFLGIIFFYIFENKYFIFYFILGAIIILGVFSYLKFLQLKIGNFLLLFLIVILFFSFGLWRSILFDKNNFGEFDHFLGKKINLEMIIDARVEQRGGKQKIIVRFPNSKSRAAIWNPGVLEYSFGDKIQVEGYLLKPENFSSQAGANFNYVDFLKKDKIFYKIQPLSVNFVSAKSYYSGKPLLKQNLFAVKESFLSQIKKVIREPEASLLGGLILGAKEDMGKELLEDFRTTGVIHIVVLSGYNLSLVADFIMRILAVFGLVFSSVFGALTIVLFTIMTGASATVVRAALMALIIIFAKMSGRTSLAIRALFLVGFLMLLFNPMLLLFDPSFQLSFLATFGLIILSPKIEEFLKLVPKTKLDFRGILAATLATQIFVLPLILYMMGSISIISPLVNLLILIFVPLTMILGFFLVLVSYFSLTIASIIAFITFIFLNYFLRVVEYFSNIPFALFEYQNFGLKELYAFYFLYFLIYLAWKKKIKK